MMSSSHISESLLAEIPNTESEDGVQKPLSLRKVYNQYLFSLGQTGEGNMAKEMATLFPKSWRIPLSIQCDTTDGVRRLLRQKKFEDAKDVLRRSCELNRISSAVALDLDNEGSLGMRKELLSLFKGKTKITQKGDGVVLQTVKPRTKKNEAA